MIRKIIRVQNVGKFIDFKAAGDLEFNRLTLVYAENGCGKTTFSHILRSLQTGNPEFIRERKTTGTKLEPQISIRVENSQIQYTDSSWTDRLPILEIYDSTFVNRNVYSGYVVDTDHKRELYRFVIGEEGVVLSQEVDTLDERIKQINAEIKELERSISCEKQGDISVTDFVGLPHIDNLEILISQAQKEITAMKQAGEITQAPMLAEVTLPMFSLEVLRNMLGDTLTDIVTRVARKIAAHLNYCMDENGENWLQQGLQYVKDDTCPFCGQILTDDSFVNNYKTYFGTAYTAKKNDIATFASEIEALFSEKKLLETMTAIKDNQTRSEFWNDFIESQYPELPVETLLNVCTNLRNIAVQHLRTKERSPLVV